MMLGMKVALTSLCAAVFGVCVAVLMRRECPDGSFTRAAVAADSARCSQIGRDILQKGGSAVDGAIAALLCTSLVNAQSLGLGGGTVFTVMDSSGDVKVINARETTPLNFKSDLLDECPSYFKLLTGSQWIAVPGEIRGYEEAHRRYGKLPWASLFEPTIQLAREGFPVPAIMGRYLAMYLTSNNSRALREFFSDENGNLLQIGDTVRYERLADTLEAIATHGADAFYTGRIAEDLIQDIQEAGGTLTLQDLQAYRATVSDAWAFPLGDYQVYIPPPPTGAIFLSLVLNIMKGYHLDSSALHGEQKTLTFHRYVEALKFASGIKKHVRDPKFSSVDVKKFTEDAFADHIRSLISSNQTNEPQFYNITPHLDTMGTTHVSVLAEDGTAVSVTSTINHIFGSRVFSPRTGVILNNQLADFCRRIQEMSPGEQPPSMMAPSILKSDSETLVIGASGGSMITTGLALVIMNHLWFGKSLKDAIATPIVFVDDRTVVKFEPGFDTEVMAALEALGHQRGEARKYYNVVNAVKKEDGCICAVSDSRKMGEAAGY